MIFGNGATLRSVTGYAKTTQGTYTWNGPVCNICGHGYIGEHLCSAADHEAKIALLQAQLDRIRRTNSGPARGGYVNCPCNPLTGGSGACNCLRGAAG